jgi:hypothetical protein
MYFGTTCDAETDGNHGICSPFPFSPAQYDEDECFGPPVVPPPPGGAVDAGLIVPAAWTITGPPYTYAPCNAAGGSLGLTNEMANWGQDIDIWVINERNPLYLQYPTLGTGYVNVLIDWNQNGKWGEPGEHVLVDFPLPPTGPGNYVKLSSLNPPPFQIGNKAGYVWSRFTVSERPVGQDWNGDGPLPDFIFLDGETEDYLLKVDGTHSEIPISNWAIILCITLIVIFSAILIKRRM